MQIMGVQAVLVVLILFTATVKSEPVSFWRKTVTLTCPDQGDWFKKGGEPVDGNRTFTFEYNGKVSYYCQYKREQDREDSIYHFYVEGKVCDNCFELDAFFFGLALIADMVFTIVVMMVIYKCTEKKTSAEPTRSSRARQSGGQAPPTPNPDYAPLNPQTRSQGVYSVVNRTG